MKDGYGSRRYAHRFVVGINYMKRFGEPFCLGLDRVGHRIRRHESTPQHFKRSNRQKAKAEKKAEGIGRGNRQII